jgi:NAD(P)H-flavin reductase
LAGEAPFGIANIPPDGTLDFAINRLGGVTKAARRLGEGDVVGVRPLGNWFLDGAVQRQGYRRAGGGIGARRCARSSRLSCSERAD